MRIKNWICGCRLRFCGDQGRLDAGNEEGGEGVLEPPQWEGI